MPFKTQMALILLVAGLLTLGTACDGCLVGGASSTQSVECPTSDATGTITNPSGATLSGRPGSYGLSCRDLDGNCTRNAWVVYDIDTNSDPFVSVLLTLYVPAGTTPTYDLPAAGLDIQARLCPNTPSYQCAALSVIGGRILVEQNTPDMVSISLSMTLETAAHERYSLSSGSAKISGCMIQEEALCKL